MTDPPERPVQSSRDALAANGDEAGEALGEVKDELHASLDRVAQLAGPAASSIGMRNLTAELQDIGTAMARALDNAEERVSETFAAEADALDSLLRDRDSALPDRAHEPHAAPDHMNMDLAAWRKRAGIGPIEEVTVDSQLEYPLPPAPEGAGDIFVQSSDSEVHTDQESNAGPGSGSIDDPGDDGLRAAKRSSSERAAQLRAYLFDKGQEVGEMLNEVIIEPDYEPLQPPRGTEVNDPVTAIAITIVAFWEIVANRTR